MAERLAENAHDIWARKKKEEMSSSGIKSSTIRSIVNVCNRDGLFERRRFASANGALRSSDGQGEAEGSGAHSRTPQVPPIHGLQIVQVNFSEFFIYFFHFFWLSFVYNPKLTPRLR